MRNALDMHAGEAFSRYELLVPIAHGGMSRVWAARLRGTRGFQKLVAIKTLFTAEGGDHERLERMLLEEARLASQIQHPNVAQYLDLGERNGVLYVVMEWVDGEALGSLMRLATGAGGIPLEISVQIVAQACNGLHGAHELRDAQGRALGLVHCDVSPQNLMISANGAVRLIDFGIARATHGRGEEHLVAGKLAFMAP
ncbi:MAG TPA: serine/threonine-protein kinase, partial [Polyangiaceae bacterium]